MNQSLDDIISKNRGKRFNGGRGRSSTQIGKRGRGGQQSSNRGQGFRIGRNTTERTGMVLKRGMGTTIRGRVVDARLKIIAKKRQGIVDARDQLALLAKQTDARDKLNLLRKKTSGERSDLKVMGKNDARAHLTTKKKTWQQKGKLAGIRSLNRGNDSMNRAHFSLKKPRDLFSKQDIDLQYEEDLEDDYMNILSEHLRSLPQRTVQNTLVRNLASRGVGARGIPPLLRVKVNNPFPTGDVGECYYDEEEEDEIMEVEPRLSVLSRSTVPPMRLSHMIHGPEPPPNPSKVQYKSSSNFPLLRQDWEGLQRSSSALKNVSMETDVDFGSMRTRVLQSNTAPVTRTGFAQPANPVGFKVVVSNLQNSVTEEDIKELFGDLGPLIQWRLIRPGIAEVTYKQQAHAVNAVEVYHKRQLDGQPMNVVLLPSNSRLSPGKPGGSKVTVQPDLGTIHKALFKM